MPGEKLRTQGGGPQDRVQRSKGPVLPVPVDPQERFSGGSTRGGGNAGRAKSTPSGSQKESKKQRRTPFLHEREKRRGCTRVLTRGALGEELLYGGERNEKPTRNRSASVVETPRPKERKNSRKLPAASQKRRLGKPIGNRLVGGVLTLANVYLAKAFPYRGISPMKRERGTILPCAIEASREGEQEKAISFELGGSPKKS